MKTKLILLVITPLITIFSYSQAKVEELKIDTSITGFHFAANFQGTYVYTPNGKPDLNTINPSAFSFTVMPNATYAEAKKQINQLLSMSISTGYIHSDIIQKDTVINGNQAYYTSITETETGTDYKNLIFHAFYIKDNEVLLFISGDLDKGKYIQKIKETFYATKL